MDELAALGGLMLSNCANGAAPVIVEPIYDLDAGSPPVYSTAETSATDALFTADAKAVEDEPPSLPVAAMVVSSAVVNLKAVVIDQARPEREEDDEEEGHRRQPQAKQNDE